MESPSDLKLTKKYLKYPLFLLNLFGLWNQKTRPDLYFIYSFCILFFTQYLYAAFQIIYMINAFGDIEKIAEASFLLLTQATLCIKIIIFTWKKRGIKFLTAFMDSEYFLPQNLSQWSMIDKSSYMQVGEFFLFVAMSIFTISLWAILPLIDAAPEERVLPFKAWYPLPGDRSPYYEILYFYQIVGIWFSALINISIDRLSTAMTALGCAQIEILMDNLKNIEVYAKDELLILEKNDLSNQKSQANDKVYPVRHKKLFKTPNIHTMTIIDETIGKRLIKCICHHQNIVRFVKQVEASFHYGILAQFAASVGIICITGLQITLVNPASLKFVTKISYFIAMLAQLFFICRVGNDITFISNGLVQAAYESPWIERKKPFHTTLLIFMERLKIPIVTKAGNFFPLSLQTYIALLRSSYSYFAVLQQISSK